MAEPTETYLQDISFDKQNRVLLSQYNKGQYMPSFLDNCNGKRSVPAFLSTTFGKSVQLHKLSELTHQQEKVPIYCICVNGHHACSCYKCLKNKNKFTDI